MRKICTRSSQAIFQHRWGKVREVPHLAERLLATDGCWERESVFFKDVFPERLPVPDPTLLHIQGALSVLSRVKNGAHEVEREK